MRNPSYQSGFAPRDGEPAFPELWRGCIGAWAPSLGVTGATLRDQSGRGIDGALTNMDPGTDWVTSDGKYALDFVGGTSANEHVLLGNMPAAPEWSVSAWLRWNGLSGNFAVPVAMKFGAVAGMGIANISPGSHQVLYGNAVSATGVYGSASGELVHIVASWDGTTQRLYANGSLRTGGTTDTGYATAVSALAYGYSTRRFAGQVDDVRAYNRALNPNEIKTLSLRRGIAYERKSRRFYSVPAAGTTAAITGTATGTIDEADIVTGGKTILITLTGDTWIAAGTGPIGTTANTQAIIDGLDSAQVEGTGWNAEVRDKEVTTAVVRTSDTLATITLTAQAAYDITAQETITVTIPAAVLTTSAVEVIASPTFTVDTAGGGLGIPVAMHHYKQLMGAN